MDNGLIISLPLYPIKYMNEFFVPYGSSLETNIFLKPINPISTSVGEGVKVPSHSNFLKIFKKYKLVWAVFLWLSIYICLTYSEKSSGLCSSRKSDSGYFVGSTWKFSEIYNLVQISCFMYSCRVAVFWWKDYIWW